MIRAQQEGIVLFEVDPSKQYILVCDANLVDYRQIAEMKTDPPMNFPVIFCRGGADAVTLLGVWDAIKLAIRNRWRRTNDLA